MLVLEPYTPRVNSLLYVFTHLTFFNVLEVEGGSEGEGGGKKRERKGGVGKRAYLMW
jgi:hypothetical protein